MAVEVSVLFNEPKLLKYARLHRPRRRRVGFSALQRAEIAEIGVNMRTQGRLDRFSALQRAEIAEIVTPIASASTPTKFQCSSTSRNC